MNAQIESLRIEMNATFETMNRRFEILQKERNAKAIQK